MENRARRLEHYKCIAKERGLRVKKEMLAAYGTTCACCGEWRIGFLTIEHINKGGARQRKELAVGGGIGFYSYLKKRGWPQDGYEVLCFNCNMASFRQSCPHVVERATAALCA